MNDSGVDLITGLHDRARCMSLAAERIAQARPTATPLAVLWINLDRFHQINDSFGHRGGDQVIRQIAERLRLAAGSRADLARMSGDEFVCLLKGYSSTEALSLAEKLRGAIEKSLLYRGVTLHPAASIGIAQLEAGEDSFTLLQRADRAMLVAKQQGGNRCLLAVTSDPGNPLDSLRAREELEIESKLRLALDNGGLQLHYQPLVNAEGRVVSVEALMRCEAFGESLPPARFIPVAEKTGLVVRLGEWTLIEGARFAKRLLDMGHPVKVAVNVSRAQLLAPRFSPALYAALICAGLPAEWLELELTESLFMDMSDVVQENLRSAREAGVSLAIDDFGTGYSCLANLKDLPATKLKLDRSFVCVLPEDQRALAIVKAMTRLGQELGMAVVAEGVETTAQRDALWQARVDTQQGYLHARPMSGDHLIEWLQLHCEQDCGGEKT